jgi:hypothetical protein
MYSWGRNYLSDTFESNRTKITKIDLRTNLNAFNYEMGR